VSDDDLELPPELSRALRESGQSLTKFHKTLKIAISEAAGIPNDQWEKFAKGQTGATDAIIDSDVANARSSPQIGPRGPDLLLPRPWETFIGNADLNKGMPLSLLYLTEEYLTEKAKSISDDRSREFLDGLRWLTQRTPKPKELHAAMSPSQPHGYVAIIQPEYITKITLDTHSP
jgi:hypothetical protein